MNDLAEFAREFAALLPASNSEMFLPVHPQ